MHVHNTIKALHTAAYVTNILITAICHLHGINLQKKIKNSQAAKKV